MIPQVYSPQSYLPMYPPPYLSQPQISHSSVSPSQQYQSHMAHQTSSVPPIAYNLPQSSKEQMTEFPQMDSGLAIHVFNQGDDPIAYLKKAMAFLTAVASSRFPSTNNQLRTFSNLRNQANIQDDRVKATWLGNALSRRGLGTLHNPGIPDGQAAQTTIPNTAAFQTEDLDAYDSNCDDVSNVKAVLIANLSYYGSDVISEANQEKNNEALTAELERYKEQVKTFEQRLNIDLSTREKMIDSQMDDIIKEKLALKHQINSLEQNLSNQIKEKESLLQTFTIFKNESKEKESKYMDKEINLKKKIKELDNIVYKVDQAAQTMHIVISSQHAASPVIDNEETLVLEELSRSKMLAKQNDPMSKENKVNTIQINYVELNQLSEDFELDAELLNKQNAYNDLSKSYSQLEKHCISLELTMQLNQEIFQKDSSSDNKNALEILEYFENNKLKAQLQAKDITICKLKEHIKSIRENDKEEKVKHDMDEIETINIELEHSVAKLLSENERLHKEIEHLKKIYKDQFDSIKKTRALSKEHCDSLIAQLNSKSIKNADL
ncbi:hypothetical protein Tco_0952462 [Tanacetum coccineum]|uniref:Uncharacterized protein n=1 Tax=Tanacetum coccineum TaxID=301880 RepID=A0ABQ5DXU8_9ASTR